MEVKNIMNTQKLLIFGKDNKKLEKINDWYYDQNDHEAKISSFSLPAGYSCPAAKDCQAFFNPKTRKILDGKNQKYRCYAASDERYEAVRNKVWHNFDLLKPIRNDKQAMFNLLNDSIKANKHTFRSQIIRLSVHGDLFTYEYLEAWIKIAKLYPKKIIYGYTKSLHFLKKYIDENGSLPANFRMVASQGGKYDHLLKHFKRVANVVFNESDAIYPIDSDERYALNETPQPFSLLIHGNQKAGSDAMQAIIKIRKEKAAA